MKVQYSPEFYRQYKKAAVRIRRIIDKRITLFRKNSHDLQLHNHMLKREYEGYRSIDITADCRAIYEEVQEGGETIAYFIAIGTHNQLYK